MNKGEEGHTTSHTDREETEVPHSGEEGLAGQASSDYVPTRPLSGATQSDSLLCVACLAGSCTNSSKAIVNQNLCCMAVITRYYANLTTSIQLIHGQGDQSPICGNQTPQYSTP